MEDTPQTDYLSEFSLKKHLQFRLKVEVEHFINDRNRTNNLRLNKE